MAAGGEGGEAPQLRLQMARKERLPKAAGGEEEEAPEGCRRRGRRGSSRLQRERMQRLP